MAQNLKLAFVQNAEMNVMTGFDLWIFQGLDAFSLFTGKTLKRMRNYFRKRVAGLMSNEKARFNVRRAFYGYI